MKVEELSTRIRNLIHDEQCFEDENGYEYLMNLIDRLKEEVRRVYNELNK